MGEEKVLIAIIIGHIHLKFAHLCTTLHFNLLRLAPLVAEHRTHKQFAKLKVGF